MHSTETPIEVTVHSRAARRAASPSLNLDKSAKPAHTTRDSASPSRPSTSNRHALAAKDARIQKKQKKGNMTRAQRLRQQKGLERAEENLDKLELKRIKSVGKERKVKERAKGWEDVNGVSVKKAKGANAFDGLDDEEKKRAEKEWVSDEEMDDEAVAAGSELKESKQADAVAPNNAPLPIVDEEPL